MGRGVAKCFPVWGLFWRRPPWRVGWIDSSDPIRPQRTCPEVGGPKSDQLGGIIRSIRSIGAQAHRKLRGTAIRFDHISAKLYLGDYQGAVADCTEALKR